MDTSASTEYVTLETIDDVTVNAHKYIDTGELDTVIGLADCEADLTTTIWPTRRYVK